MRGKHRMEATKPLGRAKRARIAGQLLGCFLFRRFSQEEIERLLNEPELTCRRYAAGEVILSPQCGVRALMVLLKGSVVVEKRAGEGLLRMNELSAGALFGLASLFSGEKAHPFPTSIIAKKNAEALIISESALRRMMQRDFRLTEHYIQYLTDRVHFLNERIEGLICPSAEERLLLYLTHHAEGGKLTQGLTALAQSLGMSRASLYRALSKLEQEGRIHREKRCIAITCMQAD